MLKVVGRVMNGRYLVGYSLVDESNPSYMRSCDLGTMYNLAQRGLVSNVKCWCDPKTRQHRIRGTAGTRLTDLPHVNIQSESRQKGVKQNRVSTGKFNEIYAPAPLTDLVVKVQASGVEVPVDTSNTITTAYLLGEYPSDSGYIYSVRKKHSPGMTQVVYRNPTLGGVDNVLRVNVGTLVGHREIRMAAVYGLLMTKAFGSRQVTAVVEVEKESRVLFAECYNLK